MIRAASQRYLDAYRGLPRDVWLLALVLFVNRCGAMVLCFLTLYLTSQIGLSEVAAGRMLALYGIGSVGGAYLGGRCSERFGAFRVQTVCMFIAVPLLMLIPLWSHWQAIGLSLLVLALFSEAVRPANATAIARVTTLDNRARAFALQRLAANLGFSFGPAIGGMLAKIEYKLLFVVDALTTLVAACILLYFFRMRRVENPESAAPVDPDPRSPLSDRKFVAFLLLMFATFVVFMQFLVTYPLYLRDHYGLEENEIGLLFAVNTTIIVVFEMVLIDYVRHWPLIQLIGWGSFLACVGFGMLPFGSTAQFAVIAMIVVTIGEMLAFPTTMAYVSQRAPTGSEGRYMGWYTVAHSVAWIVAPLLGSTLYAIATELVWYVGLATAIAVLAGYQLLASAPNYDDATGSNADSASFNS
ncbi:MAG: MFS transporter [Planctomycetota bacterium]